MKYSPLEVALGFLSTAAVVVGQTYTDCNPLDTTCPADTALGKSASYDFTQGASSDWTATGTVTYDSTNGAAFTVAKQGDAPLIQSNWYIMFGKIEYTIQAAPGTGIVSSAVLQSDDLDEIDWEWLGGDDTQVQTNYFGKGDTSTYNRGAYSANAGNHDGFHTYTVEWTSTETIWQIDGQTIRTLTPATADTNQYPQTPMMVKVGIWAGGDPTNSEGTIQWAGGLTDYSAGPYTMYLKSLSVTDYSTGKSYSYGDKTGTWESITSDGGQINGNDGSAPAVSTVSAPTVTSTDDAPEPWSGTHKETSTASSHTTWPWVSTTLASTTSLPTSWTSGTGTVQPAPVSEHLPSTSASGSSASTSKSTSTGAEVSTLATNSASAAAQNHQASSSATVAPSTAGADRMIEMPATMGALCALLGVTFAFF
ncbi:hypothetical protein ASPZODRAFT_160254 [Penicilliopsis zonata CBS 506.65]|uniref:Crh-like protein n=1 Tax=Penicilliopsis zonata CBS 506.65 TaxID=1073090 RepID=A0A1L9SEA8_9EURO|nr:hypothetical protein ASPZODRAFT_160254 [Penicilliopsis zonata CBS 506.65]OJJ45384.1 hypothetical protein ASPZODRAFT_160254 [Penicilliopsis zonata CBS 506.65]